MEPPTHIGSRIAEIRSMLKLSQTELARRMEISPALISYWEAGTRTPSSTQLMELARHFGVSLEYLLNQNPAPEFCYRARSTMPAPEKVALGKMQVDASAQINFIHSIFNMAKKTLPNFLHWSEFNFAQVHQIAAHFRDTLKLNRRISLPELKQALGEQGIFVFEWNLPHHVSGLSFRNSVTVIFINALHDEARKLFTLAHELAHVLFHLGRKRETKGYISVGSVRDPEEKEANAFATEFLMPEEDVKAIVEAYGDHLREPAFMDAMAKRFNVSRDAFFYRLTKLDVFSWSEKNHYAQPFKVRAAGDFRVTDLMAQIPPELLEAGIALHLDEQVSAGKLAEWFFTSRSHVDDYLFELNRTEESVSRHPADPAPANGKDGNPDF